MAAKFTDRVLATAPLMMLVERLRTVQGFQITKEYPDGFGGAIFELIHSISFSSWGENITIHFSIYNDTQTLVEIKSECTLPTQVVDWGKNKKNVTAIMSYLLNGIMVSRI